jgi:hypothetical protein
MAIRETQWWKMHNTDKLCSLYCSYVVVVVVVVVVVAVVSWRFR